MNISEKSVPDLLDSFLYEAVNHNCAIADAAGAREFTLCVYLMKMREYYRWQQAIPFDSVLDNEALGRWIRRQETFWETLEHGELRPIPLDGKQYNAFDTDMINLHLVKKNLVYSAGIGQKGKMHFLLAKLDEITRRKRFQIMICGEEYARDLVSPVAMTLNQTVYLRKEALQRLLWEKIQEHSWHGSKTAFTRSLTGWDFTSCPTVALQEAADCFLTVFIDHEIGEVMAGQHLGVDWEEMISLHLDTKLELQLRAMRDYLADHLSTLPQLLAEKDSRKIHFYFAMLTPLRKSMFPKLLSAYDQWCLSPESETLEQLVQDKVTAWLVACESLLAAHKSDKTADRQLINGIVESQLESINRC